MFWVLVQDGSQWSLMTQQVQHVPGFLPWMLFGQTPLLAQCIDLDLHLYYLTIQNLVHGCGNVPQTTAENSDTPPIHCTKHVQQSVDMSIQLPVGLQCYPVQMTEVVQQEYVLIREAWLYPRVNVPNTVHLSKHHSYCLQSQNRGRNDRPPEHHLITLTMTTESLTQQPLSVHILYPGGSKHSPWGCCIFSDSDFDMYGALYNYLYVYCTCMWESNIQQ